MSFFAFDPLLSVLARLFVRLSPPKGTSANINAGHKVYAGDDGDGDGDDGGSHIILWEGLILRLRGRLKYSASFHPDSMNFVIPSKVLSPFRT